MYDDHRLPVTKLDLGAIESYLHPRVDSLNSWAIFGKTQKPDPSVNLGRTGVVVRDVQHYIFLGLKQAVQIPVTFGFCRKANDLLSAHTPNKALCAA
jgi:hypothetical protein